MGVNYKMHQPISQTSSDIKKEEELEPTQMSIHQEANGCILIYSYDGIQVNNKKEQTPGVPNNMDESQKHAEWKTPETEECILYASM